MVSYTTMFYLIQEFYIGSTGRNQGFQENGWEKKKEYIFIFLLFSKWTLAFPSLIKQKITVV